MSEATNTLSEADRSAKAPPEAAETASAPEMEGAPPPAKTEESPEEALAKLREDLDREKALRQSGETARQAAEAEAAQLREAVQAGQISLRQANIIALGRAHEAAEAQLATLRDQYAAALAGSDYARAAEMQAAMAEVAAKKVGFAGAKQQLEASPEPTGPARADGQSDPLARYTPRTRGWLQRHPEVLADPKKMALAVAAHHEAIAGDHIPDSDAYFDAIERKLGYRQDPPAASKDTPRRPVGALAPNRNGAANGQSGAKIELRDMTPRMLELAKQADMKPEEWLKSYQELLSEGKIEKFH